MIDISEFDEIKNISESFSYDKEQDTSSFINFEEIQKLSNSFNYEKGQVLQEETFDDFDTAYEALRVGIEKELKGFVKNLLSDNVEKFIWSFVNPSSEIFRDAWNHVLTKFTVSDDRLRDQFLNRIRILYRNIFLEKMDIGNEEDAIALGDAYFTVFKVAINQLLDKMKDNIEGQTTEPAQDATTDEIVYR
jgi:hypothetical protein